MTQFAYKIVNSPNPIDLTIDHQPLSQLDQNDGFIHLSTKEQVSGTLDRFYTPFTSLVYLLQVNLDLVPDQSTIKWESPEDHLTHIKFPHLYGPLKSSYIVHVFTIKKSDNGWILPSLD
ncbi:hypothetical protein BB559_001166 [Furculomyces boomerangus]|uniref:DUF952 domain-containing protein n=2 Tax=Harpellales TaxID=61421 RepID=A0A2T9Z2W8_9FUNG|nr:hypothetical protein BB559_001166 [Furculomyces boomerangus]PVZ98407.1 hypothetical protein BB558_005595 [Smittium angustum]